MQEMWGLEGRKEFFSCFQNDPNILFCSFINAFEPENSSARISTSVLGLSSWKSQLNLGSRNLSLKATFLGPWLPIQCWEPKRLHSQMDSYFPSQLLYPFSQNLLGFHYLTAKLG